MYAYTIQERIRKCFLPRKRLRPMRRRRSDQVVLFVHLFMRPVITFFIRFILQKHRICSCVLLRVTQFWVKITSHFMFRILRVALLWMRQCRRIDVCQYLCCSFRALSINSSQHSANKTHWFYFFFLKIGFIALRCTNVYMNFAFKTVPGTS